ncbi:MAG: tRNA (adenine(22)-N(1))-methyltransferase TrmK [Bacilli bacterium]|nr:tRNA (adenine(22)-N(1))-methyltransferase TrmK [Bacilli bacterium]
MLSLRLKQIADLVPDNSLIINVGTDHALLEIYLNKERNIDCIGTDINKWCVNKAIDNVKLCNLNIPIIQADGINGIDIKNRIVIISGMGTRNILKILKRKIDNDLIIQSNNDVDKLIKKIKQKGYYIYDIKTVFDGKWYVITYFKRKKLFYLNARIKSDGYYNYLISIKKKEINQIPSKYIVRILLKKVELFNLRLKLIF